MKRGLRLAVLASVALTVLLFQLPYSAVIDRPLVWLSTLAHELGHGITAVAVGGSFHRLVIHPDASGVAWTSSPGAWRDGVVAAGGLFGPSVAASACFLAGRTAHGARTALAVAAGLLVLVALLWVRNLFGFWFVISLALTLGIVARYLGPQWARFVVVFLGVQLSLSVFSRSDYLFVQFAHTGDGPMPSDVQRMAEALWLPYWFWGVVCGLFSVGVLGLGIVTALTSEAQD